MACHTITGGAVVSPYAHHDDTRYARRYERQTNGLILFPAFLASALGGLVWVLSGIFTL